MTFLKYFALGLFYCALFVGVAGALGLLFVWLGSINGWLPLLAIAIIMSAFFAAIAVHDEKYGVGRD